MPKISNYKSHGLLIGILSVAVILGLILLALAMRRGYKENFGSKVSIEYFCMSGCGFCEKFEPVWKQFTDYVDNSTTELPYTYKKYNISTSDGAERGKQFNVNSAPTLLAIKNDNIIATMETNRTLDNLKQFAEDSSKSS